MMKNSVEARKKKATSEGGLEARMGINRVTG